MRGMILLSVRQAADRLGLSPDAVRKAHAKGTLRAHAIDGRLFVTPDEIERYRATTRRDGSKGSPAQKQAWREAQARKRARDAVA